MSSFYDGIMEGLAEALAYAKGELNESNDNVVVHEISIAELPEFSPAEIKDIRMKANLTQNVFANCLGVTKKAVEGWEGGRSHPNGTVRRMLGLMQKNPKFVYEAGIMSET